MKGRNASEDSETEFVIVFPNLKAWYSPRGKYARKRRGWTDDPDYVEVYRGRAAASRAIDRNLANGRLEFRTAKYCTFGEWRRAVLEKVRS